jgi:sulfate adenylyltransferase subunit 2
MTDCGLAYLRQLESESVHILREVAAEFRNPVMLYSVGKDFSVLVRLALKASHPGVIPFPLMHVDTGYKFPEMYEFRDRFCRQIGVRLIVERNET